MAQSFEFAYSLDGSAVATIKDFPLAAAATYKSGAGTNDATRGDLVALSAGTLVRAIATTSKAIGVLEGLEFTGLVAQGQPYAATNVATTSKIVGDARFVNGIGKIRIEGDSVYRTSPKSGQTAAQSMVGTAYAIFLDAAGNQTIDTSVANPATSQVKVVDVDTVRNLLYVVVASNNSF